MFHAATKRVLWTRQGAGGDCTPSVIVDGSVKDNPDDLERRQAMFIGHLVKVGPYSTKQKCQIRMSAQQASQGLPNA